MIYENNSHESFIVTNTHEWRISHYKKTIENIYQKDPAFILSNSNMKEDVFFTRFIITNYGRPANDGFA